MIRVLVVDDSPLARKLIAEMLESDPEIEVVGTAMNGIFGLRKAYREAPDVITLDFEMPQMDGLRMLESLMERRPIPVIPLAFRYRRRITGRSTCSKAIPRSASCWQSVNCPCGTSTGNQTTARRRRSAGSAPRNSRSIRSDPYISSEECRRSTGRSAEGEARLLIPRSAERPAVRGPPGRGRRARLRRLPRP